ncbi:CpsD/CapB family tyrosine-protein kinase [Undibacterium arcticum]
MQFAMPKFKKNNIVLITGPTPGLGKSFVSVNFAAVLAETGKKVLLIDADFRNGHLHQSFGLERQGGLSEAITGAKPLEQSIRRSVLENLDFIPTGLLPRNPSKFLLHTDFGALLQTVSSQYDVVLIDAAPVLAVSDTLVIGAHAGAVFILTRAGLTTEREINESIKRLNHAGIAPAGVLFNDLILRPGVYGYGYEYGNENISQLEYS